MVDLGFLFLRELACVVLVLSRAEEVRRWKKAQEKKRAGEVDVVSQVLRGRQKRKFSIIFLVLLSRARTGHIGVLLTAIYL
ncbi:hypothetical protein B0T19DRAFT_419650, partial [Cercophora scortea]